MWPHRLQIIAQTQARGSRWSVNQGLLVQFQARVMAAVNRWNLLWMTNRMQKSSSKKIQPHKK